MATSPSLHRRGVTEYAVYRGPKWIGCVVKHEARRGVRVLWNAYLPGEVEAVGDPQPTRKAAVSELLVYIGES